MFQANLFLLTLSSLTYAYVVVFFLFLHEARVEDQRSPKSCFPDFQKGDQGLQVEILRVIVVGSLLPLLQTKSFVLGALASSRVNAHALLF